MPWDEWEDFTAGLYSEGIHHDQIPTAADLLRDPDQFREAAIEMLRHWPESARHNLAAMWSGRNAWLGQATCCYVHGINSATTRQAWGTLTNEEQRQANAVATACRIRWEQEVGHAQASLRV